jgi:hypothetical protein
MILRANREKTMIRDVALLGETIVDGENESEKG